MSELEAPPAELVDWMVEWEGGHCVKRALTAFAAHELAHGAPAFGDCRVWRWSEET